MELIIANIIASFIYMGIILGFALNPVIIIIIIYFNNCNENGNKCKYLKKPSFFTDTSPYSGWALPYCSHPRNLKKECDNFDNCKLYKSK